MLIGGILLLPGLLFRVFRGKARPVSRMASAGRVFVVLGPDLPKPCLGRYSQSAWLSLSGPPAALLAALGIAAGSWQGSGMKRLLLLLLLIPLAAEAGPQGRGEPCAKDSDCGTMLACRDLKCRSVEDLKCRASAHCTTFGTCTAKGGECIATSHADCRASAVCKKRGACIAGVRGSRCIATSDADCRASEGCKDWGRCTAKNGWCRLIG